MADEEKKPEEEKKDGAAAEAGAEGAEGEGADAEAAKKKAKKKKQMIILGGLVLVLILGGAGAYFGGFIGGGAHEEKAAKPEEIVFYSMPEMVINLASPGKSASFLKATIILELPNKLDVVKVEANLPRLMDAFNTYIRELRASDLAGSAGITRLREELLLRANKALDPIKVNDVLFKEIVVQ